MSRSPEQIIVRPLLTEKVTRIQENENKYFFEVFKDANKVEIKSAIEKLFGVKVTDVNTMMMPGKWKRVGRSFGRSTNWKKAVVTLKDGDSIELFDQV